MLMTVCHFAPVSVIIIVVSVMMIVIGAIVVVMNVMVVEVVIAVVMRPEILRNNSSLNGNG